MNHDKELEDENERLKRLVELLKHQLAKALEAVAVNHALKKSK